MNYCANCENELDGNFCAFCGQPAKSRRGPIWRVLGEFSEEIFSPDSKFFKSLLTLLFKPGHLSKQFIDGKRVSVLPPVRLYLVMSLLFFFVFNIPEIDVSENNVYIGDVLLGHEKPIKGRPTLQIFSQGDKDSFLSRWFEKSFAEKKEAMQKGNPQVTIDRIFNQLEELLPNALILFLPLFALILKMLYFFKRVLYFDHLIFSLHFQTWLMGMILIIYALATYNPLWSILTALIPVYLAKAQKVVYQQSYWLVIPKTFLIIIIYIFLLAVSAAAALLGAVALL